MEVQYLPPDHPWYFLNRFGTPNVKWCEETLHGWITEPANTWSNLGFVLVGLILLYQTRNQRSGHLRHWAWSTLVLGFFSGIYHASSTFAFQVGDFFAMFLVFYIPLWVNLRRLGWNEMGIRRNYAACVIGSTASVPLLKGVGFPIQALVGLLAISILASEAWIRATRRERSTHYRSYFVGLAFLAAASVASFLDISRIACDPHSHVFQGHALWHLLCAGSIYFSFQFYRQLGSHQAAQS